MPNDPRSFLLPVLAVLLTGCAAGGSGRGSEAEGFRIEGRVRYSGPERDRRVRVSRDLPVCAAQGAVLQEGSLRVSAEGGLAGAVVRVAGAAAGVERAPREVRVWNVGCLFEPRVSVASVGDRLVVGSRDGVLHSTRARLDGRTLFNLTLPEAGTELGKPLERAGLVELGCDVHSWMRAFVHVAPHPFVAVSDEAGRFVLEGLPAGRHELVVSHERLGRRRLFVELGASPASSVELRF